MYENGTHGFGADESLPEDAKQAQPIPRGMFSIKRNDAVSLESSKGEDMTIKIDKIILNEEET